MNTCIVCGRATKYREVAGGRSVYVCGQHGCLHKFYQARMDARVEFARSWAASLARWRGGKGS